MGAANNVWQEQQWIKDGWTGGRKRAPKWLWALLVIVLISFAALVIKIHFDFFSSHCHQRTSIAEGRAFNGLRQCGVRCRLFQNITP